MTLAMMQIGAGISAVLVRGQIAYSVPPLIADARLEVDLRRALDHHRRGVPARASPISS